jgi:hypothetical protein
MKNAVFWEECTASIIREMRISELGTLAVTGNRNTCKYYNAIPQTTFPPKTLQGMRWLTI